MPEILDQLKSALVDRYAIERQIGAGGNPDLGAVLGVERFLAEIRVTANLQQGASYAP